MLGKPLYPDWFLELHLAFFWFSGVFHSLTHEFHDISKKKSDFEKDMRWLMGYVFYAHVISALVLSLGLQVHFIAAYLGSLVVTVMLPTFTAKYFVHPYWKKRLKSERLTANTICEFASATETAQKFLRRFTPVEAFVFDHLRENQTATCLLLNRIERPERDGLFEDRILQIPVDLNQQIALDGNEKFIRYLFEDFEGQSAVLELDVPIEWQRIDFDQPLDSITLEQMDQAFPRYPSLQHAPLPIAIREVQYVHLEKIQENNPKSTA